MLSFKVVNKGVFKTRVLGVYAIRVSCIGRGFRIVPLYDDNSKEILDSYLFCRFKKVRLK